MDAGLSGDTVERVDIDKLSKKELYELAKRHIPGFPTKCDIYSTAIRLIEIFSRKGSVTIAARPGGRFYECEIRWKDSKVNDVNAKGNTIYIAVCRAALKKIFLEKGLPVNRYTDYDGNGIPTRFFSEDVVRLAKEDREHLPDHDGTKTWQQS